MEFLDPRTIFFCYAFISFVRGLIILFQWPQYRKRFAGRGFLLVDRFLRFPEYGEGVLHSYLPSFISPAPFLVSLIGMDPFKELDDTRGQAAGDAL